MNHCHTQMVRLQDYTAPDFFIDTVDLEFSLEEAFTVVKSRLNVKANLSKAQHAADLVLVGEEMQLLSLHLNGSALLPSQYQLSDTQLIIVNVPTEFELEVVTRIEPQNNTALSGLYQSSGNFCTQCEAEGFRRITYFLDRPDVMAKYTTTLIADAQRYPVLLSNGNLVASQSLPGGKHSATWEDPFKKPSYLFALVAGNLECMEDHFTTMSGRQVVLRIYVEQGNLDKCAHAMQAVKKAMRWDEEQYQREYDLDIYMIVAVSDFNMGAMENKGLNIFNTKYILANPSTATDEDYIHVESVIAHEYFHNWTGNRITCRDWFQLSLKEGLTVFRDQSFTEDTTSQTVARIQDVNVLRTQQFSEDAGPLAHPVCPDSYLEINNFYTATIYNKGAEVIRMMRTVIGEVAFKQGMNLYFQRFDGQAVTINDFATAMEDASGVNLTQFRLWYSQAGTPVLDVQDRYDVATQTYTLSIKQTCPVTPGQPEKLPMHIPVKIGLLDRSGQAIAIEQSVLQIKKPSEEFVFHGVASRPIPSLLRHFSAPVKLNYVYSDEDLQILFKFDSDRFNRWEAGQKYAIVVLLRLVRAYQTKQALHMPVEFMQTMQHVLTTQQDYKYLLSEMLSLPSEKYIGEHMDVVDPDAIHAAREFMMAELAQYMKYDLLEIYQQNHDSAASYTFTMEALGKRQLKNKCLSYLMALPDAVTHEKLGLRQFKEELGHNMTDTLAALRTLVNVPGAYRDQALAAFYEKYKAEALVVDKWFALQATSTLPGTLEQVKHLIQHAAFDMKNPNKVYSLVGAFCQNPSQFHQISGKGYVFLADVVLKLDGLNPQIAARMVAPLTAWRRYDEARQKMMLKQLEKLAKHKGLSKDVYELVSKSLEDTVVL